MTEPHRVDPPFTGDEHATLGGFLDYQRATLAWKCADLEDGALRERAVPPSALSLLGLIRHLSDLERSWFRRGLAGEQLPLRWPTPDEPEAAFEDVERANIADSFSAWVEECDRSRAIVASTPIETTFEHRQFGRVSVRWVLVKMIEEYARHNGHADLLRERIDGATGE